MHRGGKADRSYLLGGDQRVMAQSDVAGALTGSSPLRRGKMQVSEKCASFPRTKKRRRRRR